MMSWDDCDPWMARIRCDVSVESAPGGALGMRRANAPSCADCWQDFRSAACLLSTLALHLAVVTGWVVLCEAVGEVACRVPRGGWAELALVDSVFDPPAVRIKGLGKLLAHFWN